MKHPTLFDHGPPPDPKKDAAPLAGRARVNNRELNTNSTKSALVPLAHRNAPVGTSELAAEQIREHAPFIADRILDFLGKCGVRGAIDEEGEDALRIKHQTYSSARLRLAEAGQIVKNGVRRKTTSGRKADVWVIACTPVPAEGPAS